MLNLSKNLITELSLRLNCEGIQVMYISCECLYNITRNVRLNNYYWKFRVSTKLGLEDKTLNDIKYDWHIVYRQLMTCDNDSAIMNQLIKCGYTQIIEIFLKRGIYTVDGLLYACEGGYLDIAQLLFPYFKQPESEQYNTIFFSAVRSNNIHIVKLLLTYNEFNPSYQDNHGLYIAVINKNQNMVKLLLEHDDVNPNIFPEHKEENLLAFACKHSNTEIVKIILDNPKFTRTNAIDSKILWVTFLENNLILAKLLLSYMKAYYNNKNKYAWYWYVTNIGLIELMLSKRIQFHEKDEKDRILAICKRNDRTDLVELINSL